MYWAGRPGLSDLWHSAHGAQSRSGWNGCCRFNQVDVVDADWNSSSEVRCVTPSLHSSYVYLEVSIDDLTGLGQEKLAIRGEAKVWRESPLYAFVSREMEIQVFGGTLPSQDRSNVIWCSKAAFCVPQ